MHIEFRLNLISLINIALKLVRKYLLTPGKKKGSMHAKLWTVIVSTWWHKCSLSSAKFLKYI